MTYTFVTVMERISRLMAISFASAMPRSAVVARLHSSVRFPFIDWRAAWKANCSVLVAWFINSRMVSLVIESGMGSAAAIITCGMRRQVPGFKKGVIAFCFFWTETNSSSARQQRRLWRTRCCQCWRGRSCCCHCFCWRRWGYCQGAWELLLFGAAFWAGVVWRRDRILIVVLRSETSAR